jgi:hypothetical protein
VKNLRCFVFAIVALFLCVPVVYFQTGGIKNVARQVVARNYPSTQGWITHSDITERAVPPHKRETSYGVSFRYRYQVGGSLFEGDRFRYNNAPSSSWDREWAESLVAAHPVGSKVQVYYNPANPADAVLDRGLSGRDVVLVLVWLSYDCMLLSFWIVTGLCFRRILFRRASGGVDIQHRGDILCIPLPRFIPSVIALGFVGISSFFSAFVLGTIPRFYAALTTISVILLAGLLIYAWLLSRVRSGDYDLVIDKAAQRLHLPKTFGRNNRISLSFADIDSVDSEVIAKKSKGGFTLVYAPTLHVVPRQKGETHRLANWRERERSEAFVAWLREQLGFGRQFSSEHLRSRGGESTQL